MMKKEPEILKSFGLKTTPTRLMVLEVFSKYCKPINAEHVLRTLKSKKLDIVTVYRTLASFEKKGIIHKVDLRKDSVYYEYSSHHHHHHIVCVDCGYIEKFEDCRISEMSKGLLGKKSKFKIIQSHSFELFGLCEKCSKNSLIK
jgi:Fe2+ or Zn2+ uptake regulation protein